MQDLVIFLDAEGRICQSFNGNIYKLYGKYFSTGKKMLHIELWASANGSYPEKGYQLHHIDMNTLNNSLDNLQLLTKKEHAKLHYEHRIKKDKNVFVNARREAFVAGSKKNSSKKKNERVGKQLYMWNYLWDYVKKESDNNKFNVSGNKVIEGILAAHFLKKSLENEKQ